MLPLGGRTKIEQSQNFFLKGFPHLYGCLDIKSCFLPFLPCFSFCLLSLLFLIRIYSEIENRIESYILRLEEPPYYFHAMYYFSPVSYKYHPFRGFFHILINIYYLILINCNHSKMYEVGLDQWHKRQAVCLACADLGQTMVRVPDGPPNQE